MQKSGEKKKKKKSPKYFQVYAYLSSISFPTLITRPGLLPHLTMGSLRQNIRMNIECSCAEKNMARESITLSVKWRFKLIETAPYRARRDKDFHGFHLGKRDFDLNSFAYFIIRKFSPCNIHSLPRKEVTRRKRLISQQKKRWSLKKFTLRIMGTKALIFL